TRERRVNSFPKVRRRGAPKGDRSVGGELVVVGKSVQIDQRAELEGMFSLGPEHVIADRVNVLIQGSRSISSASAAGRDAAARTYAGSVFSRDNLQRGETRCVEVLNQLRLAEGEACSVNDCGREDMRLGTGHIDVVGAKTIDPCRIGFVIIIR